MYEITQPLAYETSLPPAPRPDQPDRPSLTPEQRLELKRLLDDDDEAYASNDTYDEAEFTNLETIRSVGIHLSEADLCQLTNLRLIRMKLRLSPLNEGQPPLELDVIVSPLGGIPLGGAPPGAYGGSDSGIHVTILEAYAALAYFGEHPDLLTRKDYEKTRDSGVRPLFKRFFLSFDDPRIRSAFHELQQQLPAIGEDVAAFIFHWLTITPFGLGQLAKRLTSQQLLTESEGEALRETMERRFPLMVAVIGDHQPFFHPFAELPEPVRDELLYL